MRSTQKMMRYEDNLRIDIYNSDVTHFDKHFENEMHIWTQKKHFTMYLRI